MRPEEATQTKNGTPVRIYATDGLGRYPIHGARLLSDGWKSTSWTEEGHYIRNKISKSDLDLTDWRDKIPWDCLVPEIQWVARDSNGLWMGYKYAPGLYEKYWQDLYGDPVYPLDGVKMPNGPADWKQAIAKRPD